MFSRTLVLALAFVVVASALPSNDDWEESTSPTMMFVQVDNRGGPAKNDPHNPNKKGGVKAKLQAKVQADKLAADAGSGGTKMMVFEDGTVTDNANLDSQCALKTKTAYTAEGLAMLAYDPTQCHERFQLWGPRHDVHGKTGAEIEASFNAATVFPTKVIKRVGREGHTNTVPGLSCDAGTKEACAGKYRKFILKGMSEYYKATHDGDKVGARNKGAIPIIATAGMRMLAQDDNTAIWNAICGSSKNAAVAGYNFATQDSHQCGTISGSTEGFYEYLSFKGKAAKGVAGFTAKTGTLTVGGASAQMGLPLEEQADVDAFVALMKDIAEKNLIQCDKMKLKNGKVAPKFEKNGLDRLKKLTKTTKALTEKKHGCITDYIDIKDDGGSKVGTISFLDLGGGSYGVPIAGGAQEMYNWAKVQCATDNVPGCMAKLKAELNKDTFWKAVTKWFRNNKFTAKDFAFATENANLGTANADAFETKAGADKDTAGNECRPFAVEHFDWDGADKKKSEKCIKAVWANMYLHSFFGSKVPNHPASETHMGPDTDWVSGLPGLASLLEINTESKVSFNYMEGLLAAVDDHKEKNELSFDELDQNKDGVIDFDEFSMRNKQHAK